MFGLPQCKCDVFVAQSFSQMLLSLSALAKLLFSFLARCGGHTVFNGGVGVTFLTERS